MVLKLLARIADAVLENRVHWKPKFPRHHDLYDQSISALEDLAEAGNADAAFVLGDIYDQGYNCMRQDRQLALKWYQRAAERGQGDALNNIGSMYHHGDGGLEIDLDMARSYYERSAATGCGAALSNLGHLYSDGRGGLSANPRKAMKLFKAAVRNGYSNAAIALGYRYSNGIGCKKSLLKALYWYRVAEKANEPEACYSLGRRYYFGRDLPRDYARGVALLRRAADQNHVAACELLALAYEHGSSVERDLEKALELYEKAYDIDPTTGEELINRVLGKLGEKLSDESAPEDRIGDFRQMVFNPQKRFRVRALMHELRRLEALLRETDRLVPALEGQMKLIGGYAQWMIGDHACAEWIDAALGIDRRNPFLMPFEQAALLHAKVRLSSRVHAWRPAIAALIEAENLSKAHPGDPRIAHLGIIADLGYCLHEVGDFDNARRTNRALLERIDQEETSVDDLLVRTLANLAQNEFALNNHEEVVSLYERRLSLAEKLQDGELISSTLRDLAIASFHANRPETAEGLFLRRITMAEQDGSQEKIMAARADLDELVMRIGKTQTLQ